ncbi:MAG: nickel pincer cofactor biosynthesis protein LarC, partial [Actinobacteria bacterium]|nr:nickel pincer cofactor biosynthesis protein LarC [Actinomycetota bacterium]
FGLLARAEAKIHGAPEEEIHFHEVGGIDAIVDIVGSSAALETLAPQEVVTSPIATGRGTTASQHGTIPVPAPAVVELLKGAVMFERGDEELITPTGAAILAAATTRFGSMPPLEITRVGYGAGTRDGEVPNVLRVIEGKLLVEDRASEGSSGHILIETNLDDISPELIPFAIERLIETGAEDAWSSPVLMKKGRQGVQLSVLATEVSRRAVLDVLYRETTTLGSRIRRAEKDELERHWETIDVEGHAVRVKVGTSSGEVATASPEYEDAAKVARITGLPLKEVYRRALEGFSM